MPSRAALKQRTPGRNQSKVLWFFLSRKNSSSSFLKKRSKKLSFFFPFPDASSARADDVGDDGVHRGLGHPLVGDGAA
ncbi:MAG: hypothetical protein ACP5NI_10400, partial [Acetobacteraceae bacterium]